MSLGTIAAMAIPAVASAVGTERANRANKQMAREQMQFQERMSNTSYQRAVADMRLAGINPILAAGQGGASTPGGATATMQDAISPAVSSAQHGRRLTKELAMMEEQRQVVRNQGTNIVADTELKSQSILESQDRAAAVRAQTALTNNENRILELQMTTAKNIQEFEATSLGRWTRNIQRVREALIGGGIVRPLDLQPRAR